MFGVFGILAGEELTHLQLNARHLRGGQVLLADGLNELAQGLERLRPAVRVASLSGLPAMFRRRNDAAIARARKRVFCPCSRLRAVLSVRPRGPPLGHALTRSISMPGKAVAMRSSVTAQ